MKNDDIIEVIEDLQTALSKALNNEVIREYEHLQVRAEEVVKNFRRSWTNPVMMYDDNGEKLDRLRKYAIQAIGFYKEERNRIKLRKKRRK